MNDICENCKQEILECVCMDGPQDSAEDLKRHGDYDCCADDDDAPPVYRY